MSTTDQFNPSSSRATDGSTLKDVRAKAGEAVSKLAEAAQQAGNQAKETASSIASDANQRASGFLNQKVTSSADFVGYVANSARCAADNLDSNAPQMAGLVRNAASKLEGISDDIRGQTVEQLVRTASDMTRRQPALVFGLASLAGFFLFRVLKSGSAETPSGGDHSQRAQAGGSSQFSSLSQLR
jgi:hypothetical protein